MIRLPPFDALIAFDAAIRHRSMTQAAAELGLTQSAVSHRIRRLESFMGTKLIERRKTGLAPTTAGMVIVDGMVGLIGQAAGLKEQCLAAAGPDRLKLGVGPALADHWLVRRLPDFAQICPQASIELVILENEQPDYGDGLDLRFLWVPAAELRATTTQRLLCRESVFPVCHPSLLPAGFVPGDPGILRELPLLHKGPAGRATAAEWSWTAWLQRYDMPMRKRENLRFATIGPAIAAALAGAGVVLARSLLVRDALAEGRLVRVLPEAEDLPSGKAHIVRWPAALREDVRVRQFVDWVVAAARG